jgi:hypothetical protein
LIKELGQGLGLADDRKEVGVTRPARHHMLMEVSGYAGSGNGTLVDAEVEAMWCTRCPQHPHRVLSHCAEPEHLFMIKLGQVGNVSVGADQQVAW